MKNGSEVTNYLLSIKPLDFLKDSLKKMQSVDRSSWFSYLSTRNAGIKCYTDFENLFQPMAHRNFYKLNSCLKLEFSTAKLGNGYWEKTSLFENDLPLASSIRPKYPKFNWGEDHSIIRLAQTMHPDFSDQEKLLLYNGNKLTFGLFLSNSPEVICMHKEERIVTLKHTLNDAIKQIFFN
ncbi:MAG: hypothetical protein HLUCCX10_03275 [Algoriphagus marincola HL-49]|uniref:Uncharacterized protein n=1 Tax=Algoriphagus marincola HL-49 TaxID=1305737 RepID=A0A0P8ASU6_9BACT|nr:MAG: hypothetical protein HLUCCX10_03275 [Algoriphagus marincola HL-49]